MPETAISLIKGDKVSSKTDYRDALPVNMTAVSRAILGANGYMLSHPGLTLHGTGSGVDRGGYWNERQARHFRVSGTRLLDVDAIGSTTDLGEITGSERVAMAQSFNSQGFVSDGRFWRYDGSSLTEVTDTNLGNPIDITWINGYYFFTDGEFLFHTDIDDETSIDPLKFATSEFSPDPTLAVDRTSDNQVVAFNRYSTEYFVDQATDNFAFRRIEGKVIKCGVVGTHCETEIQGRFFIMGGGREEDVSIHALSAGTYQSIATREVDKLIAQYTEADLASAVLESRSQDQDQFLMVRLPNETLLCNIGLLQTLGKEYSWTIIKTGVIVDLKWRGVNGVYDPRIPAWVYGDNQNANIGILDNEVATQYGDHVETILYTPLIRLDGASIDKFEIDTIPGHQVDVSDVKAGISLTYDGLTYGQEWFALYGQPSSFNARFIQRRLGYVPDYFGAKIRTVSKERLSFGFLRLSYG